MNPSGSLPPSSSPNPPISFAAVGVALIAAALVGVSVFWFFSGRYQSAAAHATPVPSAADAAWVKASGDVVSPGVVLFYGPNKVRTGEVLSADATTVVVDQGGSPEKLQRAKVAELYFVRADDPKLRR